MACTPWTQRPRYPHPYVNVVVNITLESQPLDTLTFLPTNVVVWSSFIQATEVCHTVEYASYSHIGDTHVMVWGWSNKEDVIQVIMETPDVIPIRMVPTRCTAY
eukprot:PhF_6_TR25466/c1_g2_i2/m.35323